MRKQFLFVYYFLFQNIFSVTAFCGIGQYSDSSKTMDFSFLRDTIFTFHPYYIEVNLSTQKAFLHSKDGAIKEFGISSGTDKLQDGIKTKEGLFVIQAKLPKWYSRQFDSTLMLNWMGFNFGIGFHALRTSGYYSYLGKKKSSHGCLRISRAIAKELYDKIDIGTPVLVHSGNNAVTISFSDSTKNYIQYNYAELHKFINLRIKQMYLGKYFIGDKHFLVIDKSNVSHIGLPIGDSRKILKRQIINSQYNFIESVIPDYKSLMTIHE
ncbi:MAG: L,D-transpeptidase [Bacteroidetes bacterium]|nr:L,D-transpeptidase [Bacteroidota bacterium]